MIEPMLATLADAPLDDADLVYEPKYDGIRAIAEIPAGGRGIRLWSRLGNDKASQFPEIVDALARWARARREPVVLDGEIVAVDASGAPVGFQGLQGRIHTKGIVHARRGRRSPPAQDNRQATGPAQTSAAAFIAFDLLRTGETDLRQCPLTERRATLERLFRRTGSPLLRLSEQVRGDGHRLHDRATKEGWEGLIAKRANSRYQSGRRSGDWRKLKIVREQEFVVGGWTEPRHSRQHFGALLLGVHDDPLAQSPTSDAGKHRARTPPRARKHSTALTYVGHVGTGFDERELSRLATLLQPLETDSCPFRVEPPTNERPHWVRPTLVAQVRFGEWTRGGILRHPVYLGLRDDKRAEAVRRELPPAAGGDGKPRATAHDVADDLIEQISAIETSRHEGILRLPDGQRLPVTNLHKIFWPGQQITKGQLFRYYVTVAPYVLPAIADRPLVMKRFPNGIADKWFYQHRVPAVPKGVRIEPIASESGRPQLVGGNLMTLLHTTQLAAISQDPWFSRIGTLGFADFAALDLDPPPDVPFQRVLDVARWIRDELRVFGAFSLAKTSGADGLHIYVPLPPGTPYGAGLIFAQIIATIVAQKHPKIATVERAVKARGNRIYIDYLQNIEGKTLASAYSARASSYAGVSTPVTWKEIDDGIRREDFTIATVPARLKKVGDLWATLRTATGVDLARVARHVG